MRERRQNLGSPSTPQPGPGPSRGAPPLFSPPFSRCKFKATASTADDSELPSVTLDEWWLSRVEENERKIAVGGFFEKNESLIEFTSAPITKCDDLCTLETEDGILVFLHGFFNGERTLANGFTVEACDKFCIGFPHWWEKWSVLYPTMMSSHAGYQLSSSMATNSREGCNVPSASTVECTNEGEPVGPSRKQRSAFGKLQRATRSPNIISRMLYDKQSPVTRGMSKSSSLSTPEYLKLKKSRSGRVIVPPLDAGCQNIVYAPDGSISAIAGLDSPPPLKGSTLKYYARKKKRAN